MPSDERGKHPPCCTAGRTREAENLDRRNGGLAHEKSLEAVVHVEPLAVAARAPLRAIGVHEPDATLVLVQVVNVGDDDRPSVEANSTRVDEAGFGRRGTRRSRHGERVAAESWTTSFRAMLLHDDACRQFRDP